MNDEPTTVNVIPFKAPTSPPDLTAVNSAPPTRADLKEILDTESHWLRQAKADLSRRDPVDAVNDSMALLNFAQAQLTGILPASQNDEDTTE